jgi:hypothetical protein
VNLAAKRILEMLKAATITRWCSKECSAFLCIFAWNLGGFLRSPWSGSADVLAKVMKHLRGFCEALLPQKF